MLERILAALALRLVRSCPIHAGPAGREDYTVMFARARRRRPPADDYEDEDYAPRSRGPRALRRFDGIGSRGSKSDMPKIIGISVAVIVLLVVLAVIMRPTEEIEESGAGKLGGLKAIRAMAADIYNYKIKIADDKLFPRAENYMPEEAFLHHYKQYKINPRGGFRYYYSVSPDRKRFVIASEPVLKGMDKCYYVIYPEGSDPKFYEAEWHQEGDMGKPQNGDPPSCTYPWTEVDVTAIPD